MNIDHGQLDRLRAGQGEAGNHIIDEFTAGRLSRRDLLRRGSIAGLSMPVLGAILTACGSSGPSPKPASSGGGGSKGSSGATIKAALLTPAGDINPLTVADQGGLCMLSQTGEYLTLSDQHLTLQKQLATNWTHNGDASEWTFTIRQGVKFHDGSPLTADDVVYTYQLHTNPKGAANALSAFTGVLLPSGVQKVDDHTVKFTLEAPNGNFPYLTSSDNYNMIILPKGYDPAKWQGTFLGTGPFKFKSYTPNAGASFVRNENYWGTKALPAATQWTFYASQTPMVLALTGGTVDVIEQISVSGAEQLLTGGYNIIKLRASTHRELSMRCDQGPLADKRVRQAIALTLDRTAIIQALFRGLADLGNDSPFAPVFPSTDTSVPHRAKNIAKAKALLQQAGHGSGFSTSLIGVNTLEIPTYGAIVAQSAKQIGVNIATKFEPGAQYYGKATFGNSDWLDATMSLVDYGHRGVPNVFLAAPLQSNGTWNAAHFKNKQYDTLSKQYIAAVDLQTQKKLAGQIQTLLLDETPIIYAYFYNYLTAAAKNVNGVYPTAMGHLYLANATKA